MRRTLLLTLTALMMLAAPALGAELGMYVKAAENLRIPFNEAVSRIETGLAGAGWDVLASYENGVDPACGRRAHTIVATHAAYATAISRHGASSGFALPVRIGIYEDSRGVNVTFVNPASLNRTVLGDGVEPGLSSGTASGLAQAIGAALGTKPMDRQIGQLRGKGYVGGMGGGEFKDKLEDIHLGGALAATVARIEAGIKADAKGWRLIYTYEALPGQMTIIGLANPATEARAFGIAGDSRSTKSEPCPGLDHAAAFPIEIVVTMQGGQARATIMDEMYRMKLYFEDAGSWAFAKNMTMPGAIEDEVRAAATARLK